MAIKLGTAPAEGIELVRRAVANYFRLMSRPSSAGSPAAAAGAGSVASAQPIQAFSVPFENASDANFIQAATPNGWRYLIVQPHPQLVVTLTQDAGNWAAHKIEGPNFVDRILQAALFASRTYGTSQDSYEARLLEIAALSTYALWLHGAQDIFIPLANCDHGYKTEIKNDQNFVQNVVNEAKERRKELDGLKV